MSIASQAFLLIFLPISLLTFYTLRNQEQKLCSLLAFSYLFYAFSGLSSLLLLISLTLLTYFLARKKQTLVGIAINLAALAVFKYWDFGAENANYLLSHLGVNGQLPLLNIALPLGISFYIFRHVGYLIDVRRQRYPPTGNLLIFATFAAFFPQVSAGPINEFQSTAVQLQRLSTHLDSKSAYTGLFFISIGIVKKILIADRIHQVLVSPLNSAEQIHGLVWSWYMVIAFAVEIYFDFSGYTDMALGMGMLFGIALPPNFNNPYLASSPGDFWQRWHISLSSWFRNYLFFPLSRSIITRWKWLSREGGQFLANLTTMSLVGLWHGAAWGFILWGFYHGLLIGIHNWWKRGRPAAPPGLVERAIFLVCLLFGWALFMSPDSQYLFHLLSQMIGLGGIGSLGQIASLGVRPMTPAILIGIVIAFSGYAEAEHLIEVPIARARWFAVTLGILATLSLLFLGQAVEFAYVQF